MESVRARTRARLAAAAPAARARVRRKLMASAYSFGGRDWPALFARRDVDGDGRLSWPEFRVLIRSDAKVSRAALNDTALRDLYRSFDSDGDGNVCYSEFLDWVQPSAATHTPSPPARIRKGKKSMSPMMLSGVDPKDVNASALAALASVTRSAASSRQRTQHRNKGSPSGQKRWNSVLVTQFRGAQMHPTSHGPAEFHHLTRASAANTTPASADSAAAATPPPPGEAPTSASIPFVPKLGWLRLSRCLHLELVEEGYAGAQMEEIHVMLDVMESASASHDVTAKESELARHVAVWRRAGRQLAAQQRHGSATRLDLVSAHDKATVGHEIVANAPHVKVAIGEFREILLERCLGESDLALLCALLVRENNRLLLRSDYNGSSISPQWLSVAERIFFALDTAGHGVLSFFEVRSLALSLVLFRNFRERATAASSPGTWDGTAAALEEQVGHEALSLMGSFGATGRGMISLQRFKALLIVRGETLDSLCALDHVVKGSVSMWNQAAFGFPLPRRVWDKAVSKAGENQSDDDLTTFLLAEGPRLMWQSEREDADFQANLATHVESKASRFAAELWRGFASQQQRQNMTKGNVAVSLDELVRDTKATVVFKRVENFFQLRSRVMDAMSRVSDEAGISEWSSCVGSSVALLDSQDPVHMEDNSHRIAPPEPDPCVMPSETPVDDGVAPLGAPLTVTVDMNGSPQSAPSTWSPPRLQLPAASSMATLEESSGSLSSLIASAELVGDIKQSGGNDTGAELTKAETKMGPNTSYDGAASTNNVGTFSEEGILGQPIPGTKSMRRLLQELHLEQQQKQPETHRTPNSMGDLNVTKLRRRSTHLDMLDAVMSSSGVVFKEVFASSPEGGVVPPFFPGQGISLKSFDENRTPTGGDKPTRTARGMRKSHTASPQQQWSSSSKPTMSSRSPLSPTLQLAQILSSLPPPDELGAREMCRGTLLKKGSGKSDFVGDFLGQRNWKERDFIASLYLPPVSVESLASQSSPGRERSQPTVDMAFSPHIRLSYFREGGLASSAPLGHVFLDAFSLVMDDHPSPAKFEKYPFCFRVSRPATSDGNETPKMDLAAVLPHDKHGRPLALSSGFPGIRHDIALRAKNSAECQRWKESLIQCVKMCQTFAHVASRSTGRSLRPRKSNRGKISERSASHPTTEPLQRRSGEEKSGSATHSRMLSRSLARSIVDWESEMAAAKQSRDHPSGSLELPPPHTMSSNHIGRDGDFGDARAQAGNSPGDRKGKDTVAPHITQSPTRVFEPALPQKPQMAFGRRVAVSGSRTEHQKPKFGSSQFDKRLESSPSTVDNSKKGEALQAQNKRVLTRAEQDALYVRLTTSPDTSLGYGNQPASPQQGGQMMMAKRHQHHYQQQHLQQPLWQSRQGSRVDQDSASKRKRWDSVLVREMTNTQQVLSDVASDVESNSQSKRAAAVDKTMEILLRDSSAKGNTINPDLVRGLEALKQRQAIPVSDDILSPKNGADEGMALTLNDKNSRTLALQGNSSPSGHVVITKKISSIPHGGGKVRRAYRRPAFS